LACARNSEPKIFTVAEAQLALAFGQTYLHPAPARSVRRRFVNKRRTQRVPLDPRLFLAALPVLAEIMIENACCPRFGKSGARII